MWQAIPCVCALSKTWVIAGNTSDCIRNFPPSSGKSLSLNSSPHWGLWSLGLQNCSPLPPVQSSSLPSETGWTRLPSEAIKAVCFILRRGQWRTTQVSNYSLTLLQSWASCGSCVTWNIIKTLGSVEWLWASAARNPCAHSGGEGWGTGGI